MRSLFLHELPVDWTPSVRHTHYFCLQVLTIIIYNRWNSTSMEGYVYLQSSQPPVDVNRFIVCTCSGAYNRELITPGTEFSRKWNKPVHGFLLRHVYASTIANYKISKTTAMFITFMLSAAAHELVMVVVTRKIRCVNCYFSLAALMCLSVICFTACIS